MLNSTEIKNRISSELLKSSLEYRYDEYQYDNLTTTFGATYVAYEDGDLFFPDQYTYRDEFELLRANLLYRLLSNELPPIRLYLTSAGDGRNVILSHADRLRDLFRFISGTISISGYYFGDLERYKFKVRQHPVEHFYFNPKNVDREYLSALLDVPSVFYP